MANVTLYRYGVPSPEDEWTLTLDEEGVILADHGGKTVARFARSEAADRFVLPSFWESVKDLGVRDGRVQLIKFVPEHAKVDQIKRYLQGALAAEGPEAISALRTRGWLLTLAGAGLAVASLAVMVVSLALALSSSEKRGTFVVTFGATLVGLIILSRGVKALAQASRAAREQQGRG